MEDYILREIDKIGKIIEVLLQKIGTRKKGDDRDTVCAVSKIELLEQLNLDVDTLLEQDDFIDVLQRGHRFSNDNLEKFAELLFDFVVASEDSQARIRLIAGISVIYKYLDAHEASASLNRYYILKELSRYV